MHYGALEEGRAAAIVTGQHARNPYHATSCAEAHPKHDMGCVYCEMVSDWRSGFITQLAKAETPCKVVAKLEDIPDLPIGEFAWR